MAKTFRLPYIPTNWHIKKEIKKMVYSEGGRTLDTIHKIIMLNFLYYNTTSNTHLKRS